MVEDKDIAMSVSLETKDVFFPSYLA
jgi:hypothetical protein